MGKSLLTCSALPLSLGRCFSHNWCYHTLSFRSNYAFCVLFNTDNQIHSCTSHTFALLSFTAFSFASCSENTHEEQMLRTIFRDTTQRVIKSQPDLLSSCSTALAPRHKLLWGFPHSCPTQPLRTQPSPRSQGLRNVVYTKIVVHNPFPRDHRVIS